MKSRPGWKAEVNVHRTSGVGSASAGAAMVAPAAMTPARVMNCRLEAAIWVPLIAAYAGRFGTRSRRTKVRRLFDFMRRSGPELFRQRAQIPPRLSLLSRLPQQERRVEHRERPERPAIPAWIGRPHSARSRDALPNPQQGLGRRPAEAHQDFRGREFDLPLDEGQAGLGLLERRGPVAGRAPRYDIGDIDMISVEADGFQHAVEQLSGAPDEGPPDAVLVSARRLADEHHARSRRAVGEHELGRRSLEPASVERLEAGPQGHEIARRRGEIAG